MFKDITEIGQTFTAEAEALLNREHKFTVVSVEDVTLFGKKMKKVVLK